MSLTPVAARCRDGALYLEPVWFFPEGFVCLDGEEPPELVLWLPEGAHEETPAQHDPVAVLERVFGYGPGSGFMRAPNGRELPRCSAFVDSVGYRGRALRVIPGTDPFELAPAISYRFEILSRPPRPTFHEGTERHASRVRGVVFEWDIGPHDSRALDVPR